MPPYYRYTTEQLKRIRKSPLCKAPSNILNIEHWLEVQPENHQRRLKVQERRPGDVESTLSNDTSAPSKRASFETRHGPQSSKDGEEIFLGPKMSFAASATAARNPVKLKTDEHRPSSSISEDPKLRTDRFGRFGERGRQAPKDHDGARDSAFDRFRDGQNGVSLSSTGIPTADSRARSKFEDWKLKNRERLDKDDSNTEHEHPSRSGGKGTYGKSKFDQPWFRDSAKHESHDLDEEVDRRPEKGWRDRERDKDRDRDRDRERRPDGEWARGTKTERDPQWMSGPDKDDFAMHTQEDFQKWKEKMKASDEKSSTPTTEKPAKTPSSEGLGAGTSTLLTKMGDDNFFGSWGETQPAKKAEEAKGDGDGVVLKGLAKAKSSRFAGFFGPKQEQAAVPSAPATAPPQSSAPTAPPPTASSPPPGAKSPERAATTEDQQGFERMMQMLRMGAASSQGPSAADLFGLPPPGGASGPHELPEHRDGSEGPLAPKQPATRPPQQPHGHHQHQLSQPNLGYFSPPPSGQQPQQPSQEQAQAKHASQQSRLRNTPPMSPDGAPPRPQQTVERNNTDFLLNLMQQQQPRSPFADGQIYGQSFNLKKAEHNGNLYEADAARAAAGAQQDSSKARGPPPGFLANGTALGANSNRAMEGAPGLHPNHHLHHHQQPQPQPQQQQQHPQLPPDQGPNVQRARTQPQLMGPFENAPYPQPPNHESHIMQPPLPPGPPPSGLHHQQNHSNFETLQQWPSGRPQAGAHDAIAPPPGFSMGTGRGGPLPPGFFQYPGPPPPQQHQQQPPPQHQQNTGNNAHHHQPGGPSGPVPQTHQPPPPGAMRGPPSMGPPMPHPQHQHQQHLHLPQGPPGGFFNGPGPSPVNAGLGMGPGPGPGSGQQGHPPGFPFHGHGGPSPGGMQQQQHPPLPQHQQQQHQQQRRPPSGPPGFFPLSNGPPQMQGPYMHMSTGK